MKIQLMWRTFLNWIEVFENSGYCQLERYHIQELDRLRLRVDQLERDRKKYAKTF